MIPPNPFDPDASFVPEPLERLFAAVADVSREYYGLSEDAVASLHAACREVNDCVYEIAEYAADRTTTTPAMTAGASL